jgi:hypothetical protein
MTNTAEKQNFVDLEALTWPTPESEAPTPQLGLDVLCSHLKTGG